MAIGAVVLLIGPCAHPASPVRDRPPRSTRGTAVRLLLIGAGLAAYQLAYFAAVATAGVSIATLVALGLAPLLIAIGAIAARARAARPRHRSSRSSSR